MTVGINTQLYTTDINRSTTDAVMVDISQKPLSSPAECLAQLLQTEEYADLNIVLPETEKTLKVHRMILSMWSPVFKAMLFGPMSEGDNINLPDDHPEAFKIMLNYMYSGWTELPSMDIAIHVYMLSNKYQMEHLKSTCSKYFMNSMTASSVPQVMNVATLLEDKLLTQKCTEVIDKSSDEVFSSPSLGSFSASSLQQILSSEVKVSTESIIFKGILTWGRTQLKLRDDDITPKNIRNEVEQFLPYIRFLTMSLEEFVKEVLPAFILSIEELTSIQQIIAGIQGVNIPKACSSLNNPRTRRFEESKLKTCKLMCASQIQSNGSKMYDAGEEREILSDIKSKKEIYLNKLQYKDKIGDNGQLIVKNNSTGCVIDTVEFDGTIATFKNMIKLIPGQKYSFVLKGTARSLIKSINSMHTNEIVSGRMVYWSSNITVHYWEK